MSSQDISSPIEVEACPEKNVWGFWATAGFGVVVLVISLVIESVVVGVFAIVKMVSDSTFNISWLVETFTANLGLITALATIVSAIICVGLIIAIVKVRRSVSIAEYLGFRPITGKIILISLAITAGFIVLSGSADTFLERPVPEFMLDTYSTSVWPALLWIAFIVFAPAFEEIFFRGFLFEGFRQARIGVIGAIGLTAAGWALLHIQYGVYEIVTIFVIGIVLGVVRLKTDSLWSPLVMHAFFNLIAMIQLTLYSSGIIS